MTASERLSVVLPLKLKRAALKKAAANNENFGEYVRRLIEQDCGLPVSKSLPRGFNKKGMAKKAAKKRWDLDA